MAEGVPRHPFMVVDENGRSFDLVRQLKGIRIKEVRQRMRNEKLIPEKEAIELMRKKQDGSSDPNSSGQHIDIDREKVIRTASAFWDNKQETTLESIEAQSRKRMKDLADNFIESGQALTKEDEKSNSPQKKKIRASEYFLNADELTDKADDIVADENTLNLSNNQAEEEQDITIKPQSDVSHERQKG